MQVVFAVQCPNPKCKKYMLVEHHQQGKVVSCLLCKTAIKVGISVPPQPAKSSPVTNK
jgi:hypothetical protein